MPPSRFFSPCLALWALTALATPAVAAPVPLHLYGEWEAVSASGPGPFVRHGNLLTPGKLVFRPDTLHVAGGDLPVQGYDFDGRTLTIRFSATEALVLEWMRPDLLCTPPMSLQAAKGRDGSPSAPADRLCYRKTG